MYQFPDRFGHWGEEKTEQQPDKASDQTTSHNVYDMYPDWSVASDALRDQEEARQQRTRNTGGGLGQPYDAEYLSAPPQRAMSAELAANVMRSQVELG